MGSYSYKKHKKSKHSKHSKKNKHHNRRKTRKMGGGNANIPCAGCRSDNTIKIGGYYLNTSLPVGAGGVGGQMGGGGQACTQSPYDFGSRKQIGGHKGGSKLVPHKRGCKNNKRGMRGGEGSFWNFAKFWNPNTGGNVLSLSDKGTSPTGLGAPVSTSGDKPIPAIQAWPAQKLIMPHAYTQGGAQMGGRGYKGGKYTRRGRAGRGLKGGGILDDIQNIGRSLVYGAGSAINGLSGYSNKIYNTNPSPTVQFPRGLGDVSVSKGGVAYSAVDLPTTYKNAYSSAASL
uniref:Uncharacterized protein n=1 Tax=viral metagenome TaxID=1070528 RepID=A0A6C0EXJ8_9ZZZZ